jgi:hypothetical protein
MTTSKFLMREFLTTLKWLLNVMFGGTISILIGFQLQDSISGEFVIHWALIIFGIALIFNIVIQFFWDMAKLDKR